MKKMLLGATIASLIVFTLVVLPSIVLAQGLNFSQDTWRFPPIVVDGAPIMRDGVTIEIPFCSYDTAGPMSSCTLAYNLLAGGFVMTEYPAEFAGEVESTYVLDLSIGQLNVPVIYLDGNPLTPVCSVSFTGISPLLYRFEGISPCPDGVYVPDNTLAAIEWINEPAREREVNPLSQFVQESLPIQYDAARAAIAGTWLQQPPSYYEPR